MLQDVWASLLELAFKQVPFRFGDDIFAQANISPLPIPRPSTVPKMVLVAFGIIDRDAFCAFELNGSPVVHKNRTVPKLTATAARKCHFDFISRSPSLGPMYDCAIGKNFVIGSSLSTATTSSVRVG